MTGDRERFSHVTGFCALVEYDAIGVGTSALRPAGSPKEPRSGTCCRAATLTPAAVSRRSWWLRTPRNGCISTAVGGVRIGSNRIRNRLVGGPSRQDYERSLRWALSLRRRRRPAATWMRAQFSPATSRSPATSTTIRSTPRPGPPCCDSSKTTAAQQMPHWPESSRTASRRNLLPQHAS